MFDRPYLGNSSLVSFTRDNCKIKTKISRILRKSVQNDIYLRGKQLRAMGSESFEIACGKNRMSLLNQFESVWQRILHQNINIYVSVISNKTSTQFSQCSHLAISGVHIFLQPLCFLVGIFYFLLHERFFSSLLGTVLFF